MDGVTPVLSNCGLVITSHPEENVLITTIFHAESGEFMQSQYVLTARDLTNPQQIGSAISYARRYSIQSILNLNTDDDDGNSAAEVHKKREKLTLRSKKWKDSIESYVIRRLGEGVSSKQLIQDASKNFDLGDDVISFINDNHN